MSAQTFIPSPDQEKTPDQEKRSRALVYFIPGNPGLIQFYTPFLNLLSSLLHAQSTRVDYDIYGQDLLGFADASHAPFSSDNAPFNLEAQIQHVQRTVAEKGGQYEFVVVMGHSVGAYIGVEVFARWAKARKLAVDGKGEDSVELRNGVLLFPTLLHIAQSPSGRKLVSLTKMPTLADNAHLIAKALLLLLPLVVLKWLLANIMGFTREAAAVTAGWLKSRDGVRQGLYLGMDEMKSINDNAWEDDLWEATHPEPSAMAPSPRFFLFYAKEDHWVDSHGRDEFLQAMEGRLRVVVEDNGVKHAFCTKEWDTWVVAKGVARWFVEMDGGTDGE